MISFLESMTTPTELGPVPMDTTPGMLSKQYISYYYFLMNLISYILVNIWA